jgi:hypothetical protein
MVNGQDFRLDVTTPSFNIHDGVSFLEENGIILAHILPPGTTELPYSSTNKPECSPSSELIP